MAFDFRKGPSVFSDPDSPDVYRDYTGIKRVWAPQIFWDPAYVWPDGTKGGYMIYYSLWNPEEEKYDRMYYSYADHSFTTLTKPRLMFDWGYATIDADINYIPADGKYHMLIKKEGGTPGIFAAVADKLTGPYRIKKRNGLCAVRRQSEMRRMLGFPTDRRQHLAGGLYPIFHETPAVSYLSGRRTYAEFPFPCHHRRGGGTAAWFFHAVDQKGIQTPAEMVGSRDEAAGTRS